MTSSYEEDGTTTPASEETALLSPRNGKQKRRPTPLPKVQMSIILLAQLAEPIMSQCIYPFINDLVRTLDITGGDESKVGYYAGLIQSLFFATEALTVLQWSRLSDRIGRKPVLLIGLSGLFFSMIFFGLSRTYWTLVLSRCLNGLLNGNIGVMKSMIGEISDSSNIAQAFALMPVTWAAGVSIGPMIGGSLSRPHDTWPHVFSHPFWQQYPYFLPCFVSAVFSAFVFVIVLLFLKETVQKEHRPEPSKPSDYTDLERDLSAEGAVAFHEGEPALPPHPHPSPTDADASLRALLTRPVVVSVLNYGLLATLDIAYCALQPLFLSTPVSAGGLGFSPRAIGLIMGAFGLANGGFQVLFLAKIVRAFGLGPVFRVGMLAFVPLFALFPVMNVLARRSDGEGGGGGGGGGVGPGVWAVLAVQLTCAMVMELAYGTIFVYVTHAAPSRRTLGAVNGIAQTTASVVRAVGPALSTSLFAFSVSHDLMGGYAVYVVLVAMAAAALVAAVQLPKNGWKEEDSEEE
ncbi:MFS general substrate transporter [Punctularia strigosozonata HHB-11173 SS5]|uniref:MFS general substrate transporter n=1 Tax=Punctularia strigosozonata (strain HHB-11173) TaxID=741275 RepID=R7S2G9_PUNST|nr:MFS general substrate transporter [Punctularia strigosozonata HHB-11173 SS5]EIN04049.1 MFS general substrate transporter [Punctularia strigosozonata HHB-11173 SS5]